MQNTIDPTIQALVDEGLTLYREIEQKKARLEEINKTLTAYALANPQLQIPLKESEREGRRALFAGSQARVPVVLTSDSLIGSFQVESATHKELVKIANEISPPENPEAPSKLVQFYKFSPVYKNRFKDGLEFRREALRVFGERAPEFIAACLQRSKDGQPKSAVFTNWDAVEPLN